VPSSTIQRFSDPSQYQASIHGAHVEILPTEGGEFRAEITKVALLRLRMQRSNEILPRILRGAVTTQRVAIGFLTDSEQPEMLHCGYNVSPTEVIVVDRNSMHRRTSAPSRWGTISITPKELAAASNALLGRPVVRPPTTRVIRPATGYMSRLLRLHETAGNLARTAPDILANNEVARALEGALTHAMVMCLAENTRPERSADNPRRIMARFDEFLAAHVSVPLYVTEICAAIGVSQRALRACCQDQLGMSPIQYLWLRRMHLARQALARATPGTSTVTRIAGDHGFWELGRFAVEYRALFGNSPSETLSRPARDFAPAAKFA
jgi:AraC-like DNA-binding protein